MDLTQRKDMIRRTILARRGRLDEAERARLAQALHERLMAVAEVAEATSILAFVSVRSEVPTGSLLPEFLDRGVGLLLPFVADDGTMRAAPVRSMDELTPGYRGIPEPRARFPVDAGAAGVVITPGVAFDARGGRLGYGGGFYDAFLRSIPAVPRVGICFELQVVDEVPLGDGDERVDLVVTEERVIRAEPPRRRG